MSTTPLWLAEFGAEYAVPDVIANNPALTDLSWHNDACPSFCDARIEEPDEHTPRLWVEHPDWRQRDSDVPDPRFFVADAEGRPHHWSDDASGAVAALLAIVTVQRINAAVPCVDCGAPTDYLIREINPWQLCNACLRKPRPFVRPLPAARPRE